MTTTWNLLGVDPLSLTETRLQLHYAIQFLAAPAAALATPVPDFSHSSLSWANVGGTSTFLTTEIPAPQSFRVALDPSALSLMLIDSTGSTVASWALAGQTMETGLNWLKEQIAQRGAVAEKVVWLNYPEDFPQHSLAQGSTFATPQDLPFAELAHYYDNSFPLFQEIAVPRSGASTLHIWPHHFDMAVLIEPQPQNYIGVGLSPGDHYYPQPYWYVSVYPYPDTADLPELPAAGSWHTDEWVGAILTGSRLVSADQRQQLHTFLSSAIEINERLLHL